MFKKSKSKSKTKYYPDKTNEQLAMYAGMPKEHYNRLENMIVKSKEKHNKKMQKQQIMKIIMKNITNNIKELTRKYSRKNNKKTYRDRSSALYE